MPAGHAERPLNQMRRHDKAQDEEWVRAFLRSGAWGALAMVSEGRPFLNTNLFVYDEEGQAIYLHTARVGRSRSILEGGTPVCFSVSEMGRILPDEIALEFSVEYAGVTVFGSARVVEDEVEKARALEMLLRKYAPHLQPQRDYRPANAEELRRTSVFRIDIDSWSGKRNEKPADFPGAFFYEAQREPSPFSPGGAK